jgi:hypothetical protein
VIAHLGDPCRGERTLQYSGRSRACCFICHTENVELIGSWRSAQYGKWFAIADPHAARRALLRMTATHGLGSSRSTARKRTAPTKPIQEI